MEIATKIAFALAVTAFFLAASAAVRYWWSRAQITLLLTKRTTILGVLALVCTFALRWLTWGKVPLTTSFDSINLFVLLSAAIILATQWASAYSILSAFYLPPIALISMLNALLATRGFPEEPKDLEGTFLVIHVGLAFLAYALFFFASLTSGF